MIYFLINNNYHLYLDLKLAKQLTNYKLGLIQVPYSLNVVNDSNIFSKVYHFPNRIIPSLTNILFHPNRIKTILKSVDIDLIPNCKDVLLAHTEMDLLNQYIIQKFYNVNAKIYLLEDGVGTMCYYNTIPKKAPIKERIKAFILQEFYKFKYTEIKYYGVEILPVMKDFLFSGVIVNFGNSILRNIPLYKLTPVEEYFEILDDNGAFFFSQPLYFWFTTEEEYIRYMGNLLVISNNFKPFYFKFHPSDTNNVKYFITKLLNEKYSNITIISEDDIAENIFNKYPVRYAITFNSTVALNFINKGVIPIFLNNIFNNTFPDTSFIVFSQFLNSINCNVPITLSEVKPGFCAFPNGKENRNTKSILEILKY